jgi:Ala-tRNA(Pro) deacylase
LIFNGQQQERRFVSSDSETPPTDSSGPSEAELAEEQRLLAFLGTLGIAPVIHRHPPLFTVEDSQALRGELPGAHVKNMFLKDKAGGLWLVTCLEDRRIRIRDLEKALGARKMSFGRPEILWEALGVRPGAVTPFAALNDREARAVTVALDQALVGAEIVNAHPLHNAATLAVPAGALEAFFAATGHEPRLVDFDALEIRAREAEAAKSYG